MDKTLIFNCLIITNLIITNLKYLNNIDQVQNFYFVFVLEFKIAYLNI